MSRVALVYTDFGRDNYERFLESYTKHPAGYPHDFFPMLPDEGMNVGVYLKAAERLDHDFLCCCTAYTEFLTDNWLQKMMNEAVRLDVGAVDVMGSYESRAQWGYDGPEAAADFAPFPNPHLRVVCLLLRRELLLGFPPMKDKLDTLRFESGKFGLPYKIKQARLRQMVVGANGIAYEERLWPVSGTFRSGKQENLIAHDKHSRHFRDSNPEMQEWLTRIAYTGDANG